MGLAGKPAYDVRVASGKLLGTRLSLDLEAQDGGAAVAVSKTDLPIPLPLKVYGVNPNWSTGVWDEDARALIPCGTLDGAAVSSLNTRERISNVFAGNVIVCDQSDAVVTLLPDGTGQWKVQVHNPTDRDMTVNVRTPKGIKAFHIEKKVTVPCWRPGDVRSTGAGR